MELTHWKNPWCWERLKARGEGEDRGWDDWMASLTQWTWVWESSGRWWRTGKPNMLQSMGSWRVRHDLATEQQQQTEMMLDKKQIWALFLFNFKMRCKAVETTHNINDAFGPGTANKPVVQWLFKFCKGNESLEDDEHSGQPSKADTNQLRSSRLIFHRSWSKNYLRSYQRTELWLFYGHSAFEANWKGEKAC